MCLLLRAAADTKFPYAFFEDVHHSNPDGTGIMYIQEGKLVSKKSLTPTPADAYAFWLENAPQGVDYAMHFRWKTHGAIDVERVHPYRVADDLLIMHNGVLSQSVSGVDVDRDKSDTQMFAEQMGAQLGDLVYNSAVAALLGEVIGISNRFIYAHPEKGLTIINEDTGVTTERFPGCWFSNTYAWTPQKWGVKMSWGRGNSNNFGNKTISMGGIDWELAEDDENDYQRWYSQNFPAAGVTYAKGEVVGNVDAGEITEIGFRDALDEDDEDEVAKLCASVVNRAKTTKDLDATRFLAVYGSGAELFEHIRLLYPNSLDAIADLEPMLQYLEAGQASFDDIRDWLSLEGKTEENDHLGDSHPNATYAG